MISGNNVQLENCDERLTSSDEENMCNIEEKYTLNARGCLFIRIIHF